MLDDPIHDADVFRESAAGGLKSGRAPHLFVSGALGEGLVKAVVTSAARNVVENDHAISRSELADSGADGRDYAGSFVTEDAGRGVRSGGDLLEIRAANSAGMDPEQEFTSADLRDRNSLQSDVVYPAVDGCQHGCGD